MGDASSTMDLERVWERALRPFVEKKDDLEVEEKTKTAKETGIDMEEPTVAEELMSQWDSFVYSRR